LSEGKASSRRFRHWAFLNDEGKELYGEVFPDGIVPVVSMIPGTAVIGGQEEKIYLVCHEELSEVQTEKLVKLLAGVFGAPEADVKAELLKNRIPLRAKYTGGSGTNHPGLFV